MEAWSSLSSEPIFLWRLIFAQKAGSHRVPSKLNSRDPRDISLFSRLLEFEVNITRHRISNPKNFLEVQSDNFSQNTNIKMKALFQEHGQTRYTHEMRDIGKDLNSYLQLKNGNLKFSRSVLRRVIFSILTVVTQVSQMCEMTDYFKAYHLFHCSEYFV